MTAASFSPPPGPRGAEEKSGQAAHCRLAGHAKARSKVSAETTLTPRMDLSTPPFLSAW